MADKVLMKGNEAIAEAAIMAGCRHYFGYPITPQTEIAAYMAKRMPKIGGTFLQAESEIAAINMVYGASAAGVRAMTSSSSPGIALKSEGISYCAAARSGCSCVHIECACVPRLCCKASHTSVGQSCADPHEVVLQIFDCSIYLCHIGARCLC